MSPNFVRRAELRGTRTARTTMAVRTACGALFVAAWLVPRAGAAQNLVARGDSLYRAGRVFSAESLYYAAARYNSRDPDARLALGRYLAARGALKVGSVLMEEARFFGGDAKTIARDLAPVYARLGDYRALDALPGTPLGSAERARVEWLRTNTPLVTGSDSVTLRYTPREHGPLGTVTLLVGADSVAAEIDPAAQGLTLDRAWMARKGSKVFPAGARDARALRSASPPPSGSAGSRSRTSPRATRRSVAPAEHGLASTCWAPSPQPSIRAQGGSRCGGIGTRSRACGVPGCPRS
jgi:hypothetical protein